MNNEIVLKEVPGYIVYYKDGMVKDFSEIGEFILGSAEECIKTNPNIKCIKPDYCYISYLDGKYKEKDIKIRYAQAVENVGIENETIKFMHLNPTYVVSIYNKGSYDKLRDSYNKIMEYIKDNNYEIIDSPRECYIDGVWNKDDENDYLTEIQIPVNKK